jgi:L-threonylcarbamoyladenylate synthase
MGDYKTRTRVIVVDPLRPDERDIQSAASVLRAGGLVAFPTETVYGLGANALDETAVGRIFAAKGRPFDDPLIVHIAAKFQVEDIARNIPDIAYTLAEKFWPGPLTLVLKKHPRVADKVSTGLDTVAVRMPDHRVPLDLIRAAGVPVAAPSANLFTRPSPTSAAHVVDDLSGRVDIILDGGPCPIGLESTVLDLTGPAPAILRPGGTTAEALRECLADLILPGESAGARTSPGMMLKHYSPKARFFLFTSARETLASQVREVIGGLLRANLKVGVMVTDEDAPVFAGMPIQMENLGPQDDLGAIGRVLFAKMRSLDARGVDIILMRAIQAGGLGLAIRDRLIKAAHQQIIDLDGQPEIIINRLISGLSD